MLEMRVPYCIFLGDVPNLAYAKTALGVVQWAPERCATQLRFPGCAISVGLPDSDIRQALELGVKSLLIGSAPVGGEIQENWRPTLIEALSAGMDVISGLHTKLNDQPDLVAAASVGGAQLIDVRVPPGNLSIANGRKRSGKRLLTVGTDCAVGKKYTALAIRNALQQRQIDCDFRATGQTGIMIAGTGIPIDAVVSDFIAGAAEMLSPDNDANHWDIIEGQGSLFQPAYAGVSLGLLHGSQPDAIVVCHDPVRDQIIGCPDYHPSSVRDCIEINLQMGRLTNPHIRCVGVSVNTSAVPALARENILQTLSDETGLPCVDPLVDGVEALVDQLHVQL